MQNKNINKNNNINNKNINNDKDLLKYFAPYLRPYYLFLIAAVFFMCVLAASEAMIPKLVKDLLDKSFNANAQAFWVMPALIFGLALVRSIAQFFSQYLLNYAKQSILATSREEMFARLLHAPMQNLKNYQASELIHTIMIEWQQALEWLSEVLTTLVRDSLTLCALLVYLFYLNWQLTLVILVTLPFIAWMTKKLKKRIKKLSQTNYAYLQQSAYQVEQIFKGLKVVKAYQAEDLECKNFKTLNLGLKQSFLKMGVAAGLNQPLTQILASLALVIVLMIAIWQAQYAGQSIGSFTAFIMAMLLLITPLKRLSDVNQPLTRGLLALGRVHRILNLEQEAKSSNTSNNINNNLNNINLYIENLAISYDNLKVIDNLNLELKYGKKIAIVGGSGAGKTSIMQAILHFIDFEGDIYLQSNLNNKIDVSMVEKKRGIANLRQHISYVSQDATLFNRSIIDNIVYNNLNDNLNDNNKILELKEKIINILERVQLGEWLTQIAAQQNISKQQALDYKIGDNGNLLSGGQKQRLAFARALYKNAPILLLDEATSALDSQTQQYLTRLLLDLPQTVVAIAHRLHAIQDFDEIIVLDQGRVVEHGSHQSLLEKNGLYALLWRS